MFKFYLSLTLALVSLSMQAKAQQCNSEMRGLTYDISRVNNGQHNAVPEVLNIWRKGNSVAIEHPQRAMTVIWSKLKNQRIRPVRYFDQARRGIEYQPSDLNHVTAEHDWQQKYQLVSDDFVRRLALVSSTGDGCEVIQNLHGEVNGVDVSLSWMPAIKVVTDMTLTRGAHSKAWTLTAMETKADVIKQQFVERDKYQTTDFADIGDNESDPFLLKMINLGFVEHGATGFYDS